MKEDYIQKELKFDLDEGAERIKSNKKDIEVDCECCYDTFKAEDMINMADCGHRLCKDCFTEYCVSKLDAGTDVVKSKCPDHACGNIVPESIFKQLLTPV